MHITITALIYLTTRATNRASAGSDTRYGHSPRYDLLAYQIAARKHRRDRLPGIRMPYREHNLSWYRSFLQKSKTKLYMESEVRNNALVFVELVASGEPGTSVPVHVQRGWEGGQRGRSGEVHGAIWTGNTRKHFQRQHSMQLCDAYITQQLRAFGRILSLIANRVHYQLKLQSSQFCRNQDTVESSVYI